MSRRTDKRQNENGWTDGQAYGQADGRAGARPNAGRQKSGRTQADRQDVKRKRAGVLYGAAQFNFHIFS